MSKPTSKATRAMGRGRPRKNSRPLATDPFPDSSDSESRGRTQRSIGKTIRALSPSFVTLGSTSDSEPDSVTRSGGDTPGRGVSGGICSSTSTGNNGSGSSATFPATRCHCPICPASFPNDLALGIHQRTHQPSHSHNDDAATVPPTPASPHGIVPKTQQFPTSVDGAACPFSFRSARVDASCPTLSMAS